MKSRFFDITGFCHFCDCWKTGLKVFWHSVPCIITLNSILIASKVTITKKFYPTFTTLFGGKGGLALYKMCDGRTAEKVGGKRNKRNKKDKNKNSEAK